MNDQSNNAGIQRFQDRDGFYRASAAAVVERIDDAIKRHGRCAIALSGGETPKKLFELLANEDDIRWERVHLFWGDERCVPQDHADSNYALACEALISKIAIPETNVHRVVTEGHAPEEAALAYEERLRDFFGDELPSFDLVLLGMGKDGHTASLFLGDAALDKKKRWVVAVGGEKGVPPVPRVTLTLPVLNNARCVMFFIAGKEKLPTVDAIFENPEEASKRYPAALIHPDGELVWFICDGGR